jgi:hypothetical protein
MAKNGTLHYVCIADAHVTSERRSSSDTLTVVSGRWAFCPSDAKGEGHEWQETEGVTIESLRSGLPRGRFAQLPAEDRSR